MPVLFSSHQLDVVERLSDDLVIISDGRIVAKGAREVALTVTPKGEDLLEIRAAERGHAQIVGRLLRAGISKDHVNRIGYQAIHEVVWLGADDEGHIDTTRVLVAPSASSWARARWAITPRSPESIRTAPSSGPATSMAVAIPSVMS